MRNYTNIRGRIVAINNKLSAHVLDSMSGTIRLKDDGEGATYASIFKGNIDEMDTYLDGVEMGMTLI